MKERPQPRAFTLVELMVAIAIIAVLIGLTIPAVQRVRDSANRTRCTNNLKQIGLALHQYHDSNLCFPQGVNSGSAKFPYMGWETRLLPFIEQNDLWLRSVSAYAMDSWFLDDPPHVGLSMVMPIYVCPADARTFAASAMHSRHPAFTSYLGVEGTDQYRKDGILFVDSKIRLGEITDGTSNTLIVGERPPSASEVFGWWYAGMGQSGDGSGDTVLGAREHNVGPPYGAGCPPGPYHFSPGSFSNECDAFHFWSPHLSRGANFLLADGSVRFLGYSADPIMPALATRAGGEAVSPP